MFHSCDELPDDPWTIEPDRDCIKHLDELYILSPQVFKGAGKFGSVFLLKEDPPSSGSYLAVKVVPFDDRVDVSLAHSEILNACRLNDVSRKTPAFQKTHGWIVCDDIPPTWKKRIMQNANLINKKQFLFLFMEHMEFPLMTTAFEFTRTQLLTLYWQMLHGLFIAKHVADFQHGDLHVGNIMLTVAPRTATKGVRLTMGNQKHAVVRFENNVIGKFIDYGWSSTDVHSDDTFQLRDVFRKRATKDGIKELFLFDGPTSADAKDIRRYLMTSKEFKTLGTIRFKKTQRTRIKKCILCGVEAHIQYEKHPQLSFCSAYCARTIEPIVQFIK